MAVRIRLRRMGKKKEVHYRVVVTEARTAREGRFIENIGYVNPRVDPPEVQLNEARVRFWLSRGAQPTDTVKSILIRQGIWKTSEAVPRTGSDTATSDTPRGEVSVDAGTDRDGSEGLG